MITEPTPPTCRCGNDWRTGGDQIVSWIPCTCAGGDGHRQWECLRCGTVWTRPPHVDARREVVRGIVPGATK